jgi:hypothetical protein
VALVLLRDRDDQAEVRVDHAVLGLDVAVLDLLRELDLLGRGQQRVAAGFVEEELERVGRRVREVAVDVRALGFLAAAVVADLDVVLVESLVEVRDLVVTQVQLVDELVQLGELDAAGFHTVVDESGDLVGAHRSTSL